MMSDLAMRHRQPASSTCAYVEGLCSFQFVKLKGQHGVCQYVMMSVSYVGVIQGPKLVWSLIETGDIACR
jgi:hypothetical protein